MKTSPAPRKGSKVSIHGHQGTFTVIRVDKAKREADVELTTGTHKIEKHIPFGAIRSVEEDVNQAAARVIREATEKI